MIINARFVLVLITIKNKNDKISSSTDFIVEDVIRQLTDRESRLFSDVNKKNQKDHVEAFEANSSRSQLFNQDKSSRRTSFKENRFQKNQSENQCSIKCFNCHSFNHLKEKC